MCGGEEAIRSYCFNIAKTGGMKVAEVLETEVMGQEFEGSVMTECCFANVKLPLKFKNDNERNEGFELEEAGAIAKWINMTAVKEFDTYLQIAFHTGAMWVRLSGQIYVEVGDFEWVGWRLKEICERVEKGEMSKR
jgi:hypothetical protein